MFKAGLIVVFAAAAPSMAAAQPDIRLPDAPHKTLQKPLSRAPNPCTEFGPGFVKVDGSDTCVRLGGSVSVGTSGGAGARSGAR
jgi:hypothetical protein